MKRLVDNVLMPYFPRVNTQVPYANEFFFFVCIFFLCVGWNGISWICNNRPVIFGLQTYMHIPNGVRLLLKLWPADHWWPTTTVGKLCNFFIELSPYLAAKDRDSKKNQIRKKKPPSLAKKRCKRERGVSQSEHCGNHGC